jgi:E3 ubiquitin-protein ligase RNF13
MVSVPEHACTPIKSPPNISYVQPDEWIALIMRTPTIYGNCSFDVKVHNAQLAGFKAAIVYNSESDDLLTMSSSGKYSIKIPSVFVGHSSGIEMKMFYTYTNQTYVVITTQENDLSFLIIPFVCIVSICFLIAVSIFVSLFLK